MGISPDVLYSLLSTDLRSLVPGLPSSLAGFRKEFKLRVDSEVDVRRKAAESLIVSSLKKWEETEDPGLVEADCWKKFSSANRASYFWKLNKNPKLAVGYAVSEARQILYKWFGECFGMAEISRAAQFGPGRSYGMRGKFTSLYFKLGGDRLTCSRDFIRSWYETDCESNPTCALAEEARRQRFGAAEVVSRGKLSFVPKSWNARRSILVEPSLNTYYQLGLGSIIEGLLRKNSGVDLSLQDQRNAELAKLGSTDGSYATIDLSQCSDYISVGLCRYLLPPSLFRWLMILRTGTAEYRDQVFPLGMIGTMGNGFTFPLMTSILTAICLAVYKVLDISISRPSRESVDQWNGTSFEPSWVTKNLGNFGVFGDDVVLLTRAYNLFTEVVEFLGLKVNEDKSFSSGAFRESCGSDWFRGSNVRGVYISSLDGLHDIYSAFNRLAVWSARHKIPLPSTLCFLYEASFGKDLIPPDEGISRGIIVPKPLPEHDSHGSFVYSRRVLKPFVLKFNPSDVVDGSIVGSKKWLLALTGSRGLVLNEFAAWKVLLAGSLRRLRDTPRVDDKRYRSEVARSIRWGWHTSGLLPAPGSEEFDTWNSVVVDSMLQVHLSSPS